MAMQCEEKPRLLRKIQIQTVAAELEKAEAKNLGEEKCEVATISGILMTISVCGRIWNNSANDWPASSLQHCACMNSTPGD